LTGVVPSELAFDEVLHDRDDPATGQPVERIDMVTASAHGPGANAFVISPRRKYAAGWEESVKWIG
jgi:hypothetical protein